MTKLMKMAAFAAALGTLGCDDDELTRLKPVIRVEPGRIELANMRPTERVEQELRVTNEGSAVLDITEVALSNLEVGFEVDLAPMQLAVNQSQTFTVAYAGAVAQSVTAELRIASNDAETPAVVIPLTGFTPDVPPPPPPPPNDAPVVQILEPAAGAIFEPGETVRFVGMVSDADDGVTGLTVRWTSSVDGDLGAPTVTPDGRVELTVSNLSSARHTITLIATDPKGASGSDNRNLGVCGWQTPHDFDAELDTSSWALFGSARRDPRGWVELTGLQQGVAGALYNTGRPVDAGNVEIGFRLWTGGGSGADGFSMTVLDVNSPGQLGTPGGCLGYATYPFGCWVIEDREIRGFHIEFDTWFNAEWDPTRQDHVAVMLNGNPEVHHLWAALGDIEDSQWHDVIVRVRAPHVTVEFDGMVVIDGDVPGLEPFTGVIGFTGATGGSDNYHRFDELQVRMECVLD